MFSNTMRAISFYGFISASDGAILNYGIFLYSKFLAAVLAIAGFSRESFRGVIALLRAIFWRFLPGGGLLPAMFTNKRFHGNSPFEAPNRGGHWYGRNQLQARDQVALAPI